MATMRRMGLAAFGVAGLLAAVMAAALISLMLSGPDQVALAMADADLLDVLSVALRRVASLCLDLLRML